MVRVLDVTGAGELDLEAGSCSQPPTFPRYLMREQDIRDALRTQLKRRFSDEPNSLLVEELGLCQGSARVDVAVVNGRLNGYEIKSKYDTLQRLPSQEDYFSRVFDTVTIVTAQSHLEAARESVPDWWGIEAVDLNDGEAEWQVERAPSPNPSVDSYSLVQLLWKDEALAALEERGLDQGLRTKPRRELWKALVKHLSVVQINSLVRRTLKEREGWLSGPRLQLGDE